MSADNIYLIVEKLDGEFVVLDANFSEYTAGWLDDMSPAEKCDAVIKHFSQWKVGVAATASLGESLYRRDRNRGEIIEYGCAVLRRTVKEHDDEPSTRKSEAPARRGRKNGRGK